MTLLAEIIDGAARDDAVPSLLRKLKIVAARTGTGQLADWVRHELDGYPDEVPLPRYRGPYGVHVLGHFVGNFQREVKNVPIPTSIFPDHLQDSHLFQISFHQAVAQLEDMARLESINIPWPADAVRYFNHGTSAGIIQPLLTGGMALATANRPVARQVVVGVLDGVRNRVLDLALELEAAAPQAGQPDAPESVRGSAQSVVNNFFGDVGAVAMNSSDFEQNVEMPARGDDAGLERALRQAGVPDEELEALRAALAEDREEAGGQTPSTPGTKVRAWMGRTTGQVMSSAATTAVTQAITAYFGG